MRHRKRFIVAALALAVLFVVSKVLPTGAQRDLRAYRAELREKGALTELADYALPLSPDDATRISIIMAPATDDLMLRLFQARAMIEGDRGVAIRGWTTDPRWDERMGVMKLYDTRLDASQREILDGHAVRLPRSADAGTVLAGLVNPRFRLPLLAEAFATRTLWQLRAGRADEAWTDLRTMTLLAANYRPDPTGIAHVERTRLLRTVFANTWEAMQEHTWSDEQLAGLEGIWRDADFLRELDEVPRAAVAVLHGAYGMLLPMPSPPSVPRVLYERFMGRHVRHDGPSDELKAIRLCVGRAAVLSRAITQPTWREMSRMPDMAHAPELGLTDWGTRVLESATGITYESEVASRGIEPHLRMAVEAEAMRRLVLAAIAVERTALRLGQPPVALSETGPVPVDFMDGEPLRYVREANGTYMIYSVGIDLADDGGRFVSPEGVGAFEGDIVWPRCVRENSSPKSNAP